MANDFQSLQRPLWLVIGRLARRGYPVQPADARDLIHDFYLEEWESVQKNFDSARGSFEGYVFAAFYYFARSRIVQMERARNRLLDLDSASSLADSAPAPEETADAESREAHMREAMARLPAASRDLLRSFLFDAGANQRKLARKLGISRYRLNEDLIDALGQLAVETGGLSAAHTADEKVALALWRDGNDARSVASDLNIPLTEVHAARKRNVAQLLTSLLPASARKTQRNTTMNIKDSKMSGIEPALQLLKRALTSKRDADLLAQVRSRADEIVEALDEDDEDYSESERAALEQDPEWAGEVLQALAAVDDEPDEAETEMAREIERLQVSEDKEIGAAFGAMMRGLPQAARVVHSTFSNAQAPQLPREAFYELFDQPSVRAAGAPASGAVDLFAYGVTPATVFEATEGVSYFAEQHLDAFGAARLVFSRPQRTEAQQIYAQLLAMIRATPTCPAEAAAPLLDWLGVVALYRPYLFARFRVANRADESLVLVPDRRFEGAELYRRWTMPAAVMVPQQAVAGRAYTYP